MMSSLPAQQQSEDDQWIPCHSGSYRVASASSDEPSVNMGPWGIFSGRTCCFEAASRLWFLPNFVHDIAPSAQRFGDAGRPCFFGGRKTVHMVTDFVEHIMMLSTRSSESETSIVELTTVALEPT